MPSDEHGALDRRYICTDCDSVVRARYHSPGGFSVGCDCTTVPVVPQMGQYETPDNWRVEREDCCANVEPSELETIYGNSGADYECPDCGATYSWDGQMQTGPDHQKLVTDGGKPAELQGRSPQAQKPFYCSICDSGFLSHVRLVEHDCEKAQEDSA